MTITRRADDGAKRYQVIAHLTEWKTSANGVEYSPTEITLDGRKLALHFPRSVGGAALELGVDIRCVIKRVGDSLTVDAITLTEPPKALSEAHATLQQKTRTGATLTSTVAGHPVKITIAWAVMKAAGIASLEPGTDTVVDAIRIPGGEYQATVLRFPTAADAFCEDPLDKTFVVNAYASFDWPAQNNFSASMRFMSVKETFGIQITVPTKLLEKAAILRLVKHSGTPKRPHQVETTLLCQAQDTLRTGTSQDISALGIDMVQLEIEWVPAKKVWRTKRLLQPRANRDPIGECEIIEDVQGVVISVLAPAATQPPLNAGGDGEEQMEGGISSHGAAGVDAAVASPREIKDWEVMVKLSHPDVGRMEAIAKLTLTEVQQGGICEGVPVVVRLGSYKGHWYVRRIHRAYPHERSEHP